MAFLVSPGINVSETDLTHVVPNVSTTIGAIAGSYQWGPVMERITVTSENELIKTFGKPTDHTFQHVLSAANYLAYANNLIVVRNVGPVAKNAAVGDIVDGTNKLVKNKDDYDASSFTDQVFIAKYPGTLGNSLKAIAIDSIGWGVAASAVTGNSATADQKAFISHFNGSPGTSTDVAKVNGSNDEIHILVIDEGGQFTGTAGQVLETWAYISMAKDALRIDGSSNYVKNVLANESDYVWLGSELNLTGNSDDTSPLKNAGSPKMGADFKRFTKNSAAYYPGGSLGGVSANEGVDDNQITPAVEQLAYTLYNNPDVVDVTLLMQGGCTVATGATLTAMAESRKDCIALVSPDKGTVVGAAAGGIIDGVIADKGTMGSSNYGVMDSAYKYQYDKYRDMFVYLPMNADIAGLCARTDFTNDAWYSPAGLNRGQIKNIIKLSYDASQADRDKLYKAGCNPFNQSTGQGIILYGDKTMQIVPSAFDRINVRRLFIVLEKAIYCSKINVV